MPYSRRPALVAGGWEFSESTGWVSLTQWKSWWRDDGIRELDVSRSSVARQGVRQPFIANFTPYRHTIGSQKDWPPRRRSVCLSSALIVAVAIRLYLNATVPSDQYGTAIGTVRSGGSSLFSGLSGLSGSGNHIDVEEMGEFGSLASNSAGSFIGKKNITWHKLCEWPKWVRYASLDII